MIIKPILYQALIALAAALFGVGGTMGVQKLTSAPAVKLAIPAADIPAPVQKAAMPLSITCDFGELRPQLNTIEGMAGQMLEEWRRKEKEIAKARAAANFRPTPKPDPGIFGFMSPAGK